MRWQPQRNVFGVISEENGVDFIKEMVDTAHIEPLGISDGVDVLGEGATACIV